jgi:hypothetical protein
MTMVCLSCERGTLPGCLLPMIKVLYLERVFRNACVCQMKDLVDQLLTDNTC